MTKNNYRLIKTVAICIILSLMTSCGLAERKREKEAFKEFPTLPGDEMFRISNIKQNGVMDSTIIVKNNGEYYRVWKDGFRMPVDVHWIRK